MPLSDVCSLLLYCCLLPTTACPLSAALHEYLILPDHVFWPPDDGDDNASSLYEFSDAVVANFPDEKVSPKKFVSKRGCNSSPLVACTVTESNLHP